MGGLGGWVHGERCKLLSPLVAESRVLTCLIDSEDECRGEEGVHRENQFVDGG